jgi:hypothetical protein
MFLYAVQSQVLRGRRVIPLRESTYIHTVYTFAVGKHDFYTAYGNSIIEAKHGSPHTHSLVCKYKIAVVLLVKKDVPNAALSLARCFRSNVKSSGLSLQMQEVQPRKRSQYLGPYFLSAAQSFRKAGVEDESPIKTLPQAGFPV